MPAEFRYRVSTCGATDLGVTSSPFPPCLHARSLPDVTMKEKLQAMYNGYISQNLTNGHSAVSYGHAANNDDAADEVDFRVGTAVRTSVGEDSSDDSTINTREGVTKACKKVQLERARSVATTAPDVDSRFLTSNPVRGEWVRKRKLILHLDIRNTILVADSVTDVAVEEALNSFLTGVVWGRETNGQWQWHSNIPSLKAPEPGLQTYYKYLEQKLVKNPADRVQLRLQTGDFAHSAVGKAFNKHFQIHLKRLSWEYGWDTTRDKVLTMDGRDGKPYHYILPSVYKLIQHLTENKRDFSIIIRTYGRDANNVLSSLHYGIKGHHPYIKAPLFIPVHKIPGTLTRTDNTFELKTFKPKRGQDVNQMLTHEKDIYRFFCNSQGISGFVDDFHHWQANKYDHGAGKPIWIDPSDQRHHHIFFDDNFRVDDEDSILDARVFRKENPGKSESLSHAEVGALENVCLVQADLLESIADEDYFIKMVNRCEENYARLIHDGEL